MESSFVEKISQNRSFIMGFSIISIMLFHQQWINFPPFNAFHIWGHYGVDIFLFVSGFGLAFSINKYSQIEFYKRRVMRLLPLCIFCGILKYSVYSIWNEHLHELRNISLLTLFGLDLWFIQTILIFYLLAPYIYKMLIKGHTTTLLSLYFICVATSIFFPDVQNNITGSINRLPAFALGMAFVINQWDINRRIIYLSMICFLLAMLMTVFAIKDIFHLGNDLSMYPLLALGIPSIVYIIGKIKKKLWKTVYVTTEYIGNHTLELYLWHEFIYGCIWLTLNGRVNNAMLVIIAFAISFILAFTSFYVVDYIKIYVIKLIRIKKQS